MEPISQPVLFVSHGAPTLALDGGDWGAALAKWAGGLKGLRAVVIVSAHWQSPGPIRVTAHPLPDTMHDFGGFPEPLYHMRYPAPGDPALAERVAALLRSGGVAAELDPQRALDHGAWVPLRAAFPDARVPVVQVSLPTPRSPREVFELGRLLAPLRQEGVVLAGSGGVVHNLRLLEWSGHPEPAVWAVEFEAWVAERLERREPALLFEAARSAPTYAQAVPTSEHFDPLFFALGAAGEAPPRTVYQGWQYGSLSLRTWAWQ